MQHLIKSGLVALLIFTAPKAFGQRSTSFLELGGYGMTQNYLGDVNNYGLSALVDESRLGLGVQLKYNTNSIFSYGADVNFGSLYSHDKLHGNAARNYIVDTDVLNVNAFTNIHFKHFGKYRQYNSNTPFVHLGLGALSYTPHLNTNAQYPAEIALYPGTGHTYTYAIGMGWRIRRNLKTFYNLGLYYNGFGASNVEGFNLSEGTNSPDGSLTFKFGMSLGFFEQ
ncbi:MAG: hypothetical protein RL754_85 [Bacteroidota bacterium]|jgi:hypothetical protein